jgi:hypothetical protein
MNELREENGSKTLYKDGQPAFCYRVPPMIMQKQFGNPEIQRMSCTSNCPAFQIKKTSGGTDVHIHCSGSEIIYPVKDNGDAPASWDTQTR